MATRVLAAIAAVLFVIATILAWIGRDHADAIAYAGLAFLAASLVCAYAWRSGRIA